MNVFTLRVESPSIFLDLPDLSRKIEGDSARRVECYLHENEKLFPHQRLGNLKPRFDAEARGTRKWSIEDKFATGNWVELAFACACIQRLLTDHSWGRAAQLLDPVTATELFAKVKSSRLRMKTRLIMEDVQMADVPTHSPHVY